LCQFAANTQKKKKNKVHFKESNTVRLCVPSFLVFSKFLHGYDTRALFKVDPPWKQNVTPLDVTFVCFIVALYSGQALSFENSFIDPSHLKCMNFELSD
jgi:hypothetical protein